ncbi:MAG TPA: tRNA (adenosine(37)-N6)-threonylcarbamoyltransferase complex ATPase subunit type 1 TsaE [Rhodospirillales bacterium]|nr:tRNA (adenosine(37)-N6)-threonylcarbamoyltransferase complex ATPase subunit type 1 TsaE [Rhodospirillales bacterium]
MKIDLTDQAATERLAGRIAALARKGDILALHGDLGTGKTVFARAFVRALCGPQTEVPSPTFTLLQVYPADQADIYHFDLYRLEQPQEAFELGLDEAFADGICLIEWPERLGYLQPAECLNLAFAYGTNDIQRTLALTGSGNWADRLREAHLAA